MAKRVAYLGMFAALGLVLGWLESLVPLNLLVPGVKLGLANITTILVLYRFGIREAAIVNLLRIGLSGLLFSNLSVVLYSLAGAVLSLLCMALLKKTNRFSVVGVSVAGGVAHNLGQLLMAAFLMTNKVVFYYVPVLIISGVLAGVMVGLAGAWLHRHLPAEIS